ncbi:MAG: hypothetical protein ACYCSR_06030 [Thiomonas sp.]
MSEPTFAQMVQIHSRHLAGETAEAIAARLGLPLEQVLETLFPPARKAHHETHHP